MSNNNNTVDSFKNIKEVIKVINDLRDFGIESEKIELPKIVVIGVQSSGKSSLLEQIVQIDFLPRGSGVVTRCPLEIRLIEDQTRDQDFHPYAYFYDQVDFIFKDFELVKKKINEITQQYAGGGKRIVDKPITLTIYQKKCPTLTLIDLPGMTLNSIEDQEDIEKVTQDMTLKYIQENSTIILCVIPINQDLENSLALKLARSVDKVGDRTIGVLTMIDIMNPGTSCEKVLKNEIIPLTHRYYGMKPRSQVDINNNIRVDEAIKIEQEFFQKSLVYSKFPQFTGTVALTFKLSSLLDSSIRTYLPGIYEMIKSKLKSRAEQRKKYGNPFPTEINKQQKKLNEIINQTSEKLKRFITNPDSFSEYEIPQYLIVNDCLGKQYIDLLLDTYSETNLEQFTLLLRSYKLQNVSEDIQKFRIPVNGFIPFQALQSQVKRILVQFEQEAIELLITINDYIKKIINYCVELQHFPNVIVKREIQKMIVNHLQRNFIITYQHIKTNFRCYKEYIFSKTINIHQEEIKLKSSQVNFNNQSISIYQKLLNSKGFFKWSVYEIFYKIEQQIEQFNLKEEIEVEEEVDELEIDFSADYPQIRDDVLRFSLIFYKYIDNFRKYISDQVPQYIQTLLINSLDNQLFFNLFSQLFSLDNQKNLHSILQEDPKIKEERSQIMQSYKQLKKAYEALKSLCEYNNDCDLSEISSPAQYYNTSIQNDIDYDDFNDNNIDDDYNEINLL